MVFDPTDGLYRGEQSFLDWREQTYPGWTATNVLAIAMSKSLSVNALNYFLLKTAVEYAGKCGLAGDQKRYAQWAEDLKKSINSHFFDPASGATLTGAELSRATPSAMGAISAPWPTSTTGPVTLLLS